MAEFIYKDSFSYLTNICLNLTDACNYHCRYCFVAQQPHYMTYEVAKNAVDFIVKNLQKQKEFDPNAPDRGNITFFGGEPTLMWDSIIVPITNYIKENHFNISLNMTTNGSLLNEERIKFLKDNEISILLSMDGDRETQTYNRPSADGRDSFDLTSKNIPALLEAFPNTTFRATIYAPTAHHTFENYLYAMDQGFKNIYLLPDSRHPWTNQEKENLHQELNKIYSCLSYCFSNNINPPMNFRLINRAFENILKHDMAVVRETIGDRVKERPIMRCGLGTTLGSIGYDGNIYGCQEQTSQNTNSIFYIGNIFNGGIDRELHSKLLKDFHTPAATKCVNEKLCENCPLSDMCFDYCCPSTSYDVFGSFFIDSEIHCLWNRWMFENSIILMDKYTKENNQTFKNYLDNQCNFKKYFPEGGETNV